MERELRLRIVLEKPPAGVAFGIQKGRGSVYETILRQESDGSDLVFDFSVTTKSGRKTGEPDFGGPIVQGPAGGRFVYIDIGTLAGQPDSCWSRRLKIPLSGIAGDALEAPAFLEARVPGTGRDGGPNCATVKPFGGWKIKTRGA